MMEDRKIVSHDELMLYLSQGYTVIHYLKEKKYEVAKICYCCEGLLEDGVLLESGFPP
tara:strand:+ start:6125 stop:6298 length:174 start_codon:yes stop_codon:yes gene_type:complete